MITLSDCEAFCDAPPDAVHELARRECLGPIQACARAQAGNRHHSCHPLAPAHGAYAIPADHPKLD